MERFKNSLKGYYIGDAYGAPYDLNESKNPKEIQMVEPAMWTENGDIVAAICSHPGPEVTLAIRNWRTVGFTARDPPQAEGISKIVERIIDDPQWLYNPNAVAAAMAHKGNISLVNTPVATSIMFISAGPQSLDMYAGMFVADIIARITVRFYINILREILSAGRIADAEDTIRRAAGLVFIDIKYEDADKFTNAALDYSRQCISKFNLAKDKFHIIGSIKIICYTLRVLEYAHRHGATPNLDLVMQWIASNGGDASTNCALAGSMICAAECGETGELWDKLANREWLSALLDRISGPTR